MTTKWEAVRLGKQKDVRHFTGKSSQVPHRRTTGGKTPHEWGGCALRLPNDGIYSGETAR
jgi:hypothetical protein